LPILVLAVFGAFISLLPLVYLLVRVSEIGFTNLLEIFSRQTAITPLLNSFALVLLVTATSLIVGIIQAWVVVRSNLKFKFLITISAIAPLAIPSYIAAYAWLSIFPSFSGLLAAWLVLSLCTSPYVFLAISAALIRNNRTTEEVARTLGYNQWQTLRLVTWPEIRTAAYGSGLLAALYVLSDFGAVSLLRFETFTRAIYTAYRAGFDRSTAAALALLLVAVTLILLYLHNRLPETTLRRSEKTSDSNPADLGRWKALIVIGSFIWLAAGTLLPIGSLTYWNIRGRSEADLAAIGRALINTTGYALAGGLIVTLIGVAIAIIVVRHKSRFSKLTERSIWLSHALPGIVFALAFVFLSNKFLPSIYQTNVLVLLAYLGLFLPNAISVLKTPFTQIPTSLDEVARTFGYNQLQVIRKVLIPAALPGILSAAAFVSLTIIKELPATLILRPTGIETMATKLWAATNVNAFSSAAPYAALLIILAGIPALLLNQEIRRAQISSNLNTNKESNVERV
jgi:iron(III) transport system permease protein